MKKLKKIKIIEDGRICSPQEMNQIRGGEYDDNCPSFTGCNKYDNCGLSSLVSCKPAAAYGYESNGSETNCAKGYDYKSCCSAFSKYFSCGGGTTY